MTLDEWIKCLEECFKELKIPETQNARDWKSLYNMLIELKWLREVHRGGVTMNLDVFWQRLESAIIDYGECDVCPVNAYAKETNTVPMCYFVGDCADGLMKLYKKLQEKEDERNRIITMDKERGGDCR